MMVKIKIKISFIKYLNLLAMVPTHRKSSNRSRCETDVDSIQTKVLKINSFDLLKLFFFIQESRYTNDNLISKDIY